jgi:hypothetical protein
VVELSKSIAFPFRDPHWLPRVLLGGTLKGLAELLALPLVFAIGRRGFHFSLRFENLALIALALSLPLRFILLGYFRRLIKGTCDPTLPGLPAWDEFGNDLIGGIKLTLVAIAVFLPTIAVLVLMTLFLSSSAQGLTPLVILLLAPPLVGLTLFYLPAALVTAISTGDLAAAFDVKRVFARIGQNLGFYLLAFLITVTAKILSQVGLIVCCIGVFFTGFLADLITAHVFASVFLDEPRGPISLQIDPPFMPPPLPTAQA